MLLDLIFNIFYGFIWCSIFVIYGFSILALLSGTFMMLHRELKKDDYIYLFMFYFIFIVMTYAFVKTF
jgi:hypothetical protein